MQQTQETWVWSLGQEDHLETEMSTQSSILAWRIPWTEEPGELQSMGSQRVRHDWVTELTELYYRIKKVNSVLWILPQLKNEWTHSRSEGSEVKASACNVGDVGSIPRSGRSPGEGNGNPLQYSCLENPMDRGAWWATVHSVAKSRTQLSDFTFTLCLYE